MKKKTLSIDDFKKLIEPDEKLTFSDVSPIPGISIPKGKGLFMVHHGVDPIVGVTSVTGTTYVCRIDAKDVKPLNWDVHQVWVRDTGTTLELKDIKTDFHHSTDLPEFIRKDAPPEIIERVRSAILSIENTNLPCNPPDLG